MSAKMKESNGGKPVSYAGYVWLIEILVAIGIAQFFFLLTNEGCNTELKFLHQKTDDPLLRNVLQWGSFLATVLLIGFLAFLHRGNAKYAKLINVLRIIAGRFNTVHDNLHLIFLRHLESIGVTLGFDSNDRISLYVLKNNQFVQIARHSPNPEYGKPGKMIYPSNQGLIAATRERNDLIYEPVLPSYQNERSRYVATLKLKYHLPEDVIMNLTMHPRFMAGLRVSSADGYDWNAVMIVESNKKRRWPKGVLQEVLERNRCCMYKLINDFPDSVTSLLDAYEEDL